jgi:serine phosphatase RsbU (regulator of sigma subunit)
MRRRLLTVAASLAGVLLLPVLFPLFDAPQPHGLSLTRPQARAIADGAARDLGIPVDEAWTVVGAEPAPIMEEQYRRDPALRRRAVDDPAVGPRLGGFRVTYFRKGVEKYPPHGYVLVGVDGKILGARRFARAETEGAHPASGSLRAEADAFVSRGLPGAPSPEFESERPNVMRTRTDTIFRYRVPTDFPTGEVVLYASVYFIGDSLSGWALIEEYADGSAFRFDSGSGIVATLLFFVVALVILLLLIVIFLRKYHAGEVGVGLGALLFSITLLGYIGTEVMIGREDSVNVGFGGIDAALTALTQSGFKLLFLHLPLALLIFLAWSVGESFARERWGEKLASFDALLRRHPFNATVGESLLAGFLLAPAVAAAALAVAAIPVATGWAWPAVTNIQETIWGSTGGPLTPAAFALLQAFLFSPVAFLFILAWFHRRRLLPLGIGLAILLGALWQVIPVPIHPLPMAIVFGFGAAAAVTAVFLGWDFLASAVALWGGSLLVSLVPFIRAASGDAERGAMVTLAVPGALVLLIGVAGALTRRRVTYEYEDLAPHVRRIIERERVKAEIDAANRIQAALLPASEPDVRGATFASHYRAATEIGGDYFDFLPLKDGNVAIAFGDVAGHGLTSGIVMAMTKSALLVQVDHDPSPVSVMDVLNTTVMKTAPKRMLMTFFFGILDPAEQRLRFASAGHLDPYLFRAADGKLVSLSSWGFPLGVRRRDPFREEVVQFEAGDRLILYSDGFIEALDDDGEPFGFDRFEKAILAAGTKSAMDIKQALLSSVKKFTRNRPPEDDQTLVVISFEEVEQAKKAS